MSCLLTYAIDLRMGITVCVIANEIQLLKGGDKSSCKMLDTHKLIISPATRLCGIFCLDALIRKSVYAQGHVKGRGGVPVPAIICHKITFFSIFHWGVNRIKHLQITLSRLKMPFQKPCIAPFSEGNPPQHPTHLHLRHLTSPPLQKWRNMAQVFCDWG